MLNRKIKTIITNFSYTLISNLVSLIISSLIVLIVPKLIGIREYGYWQLYIFYSSYLGFFNIGWVEGIYLRYGGKEYSKLNRPLFASQFWSFFIYIIIIGILIATYSFIFVASSDKRFIFQMLSVSLVASVPRGFLLYVLQSTNRIKEFSRLTLLDRLIYCLIITIMVLIGIREYKLLIIADIVGKISTLICTLYICKEIVFSKLVSIKETLKEIYANIYTGIKLMIANIASTLIIGVIRFGIEKSWDVQTFGKVSLTLSISNMVMLFINAVGIIMYPILRRTNEKKLSNIYLAIRDLLMIILFGILLVYYPLKEVLSAWLPKYTDSLIYMALVFPMCVYEGKMSLLINTYLKTLREEKLMLKINLISLAISLVMTFITTLLIKSLNLAIISIVIILAFRCILAEIFLSKILKVMLIKDVILEVLMTLIFILTGWIINSWLTLVLYFISYIIYLVIKRKDIANTIKNVKLLIKA